MTVSFPSSPTPGDRITEGGATWEWDGVKWLAVGTEGPQGPTGPTGPSPQIITAPDQATAVSNSSADTANFYVW